MTTKAHSLLTGADLHEPKGADTATSGQVYISNGAGSGVWTDTGATVGTSQFSTGDLKPTLKLVADSGWVMADDGTIGDGSSGASTRANADCVSLFTLIWNNFSNSEAAVSGSRGGSAAADFASHKKIALPKMLGRVFGVAGLGATLTDRAMGKTVGEETHLLITSEMPSHTHIDAGHTHIFTAAQSGGSYASPGVPAAIGASLTTDVGQANLSSTGGSGSHNNMQPTVFLKMMVKL